MEAARPLTVAIAGNPNSGKTTFFNALTGARQHVGNYPGVTVEHKSGRAVAAGREVNLIDLPGIYSLAPRSPDERVAHDFLFHRSPDAVIDVVDAGNLERNLYLAVQLLESGVPLVIALNMADLARQKGVTIDLAKLSQLLGCPVVETVACRGQGVRQALEAAIAQARQKTAPRIRYGDDLESEIQQIVQSLRGEEAALNGHSLRWVAVGLLEGDGLREGLVFNLCRDPEAILDRARKARRHLEQTRGDQIPILLADARYGFVSGALRECLSAGAERQREKSERIDDWLTHRWIGLPIFFFFLWLLFKATFALGEVPLRAIETALAALSGWLAAALPPGGLQSLLAEGVVAGVGSVLTFLPNILILFLGIALMEDSGYMARAAFLMDRAMHRFGLHGKSFIPLLIGFGCNVPALMATRTLEHRRDRLITMAAIPFMSCSARLPVYLLLIGAFFPGPRGATVLFALYLLGIALAAATAFALDRLVFREEAAPFVMELPPYHTPTGKGIVIHMWQRAFAFVKKAGTVILAATVVVWFLCHYPRPQAQSLERLRGAGEAALAAATLKNSYAARLGRAVEPLLAPLGFDWRIGTSLLAGFAAKEVVVSTMATLWSSGGQSEGGFQLRQALQRDPLFRPPVALALMVFTLLYLPCLSTFTMLRRESGSYLFSLAITAYTTAVAWGLAFLVYRVSSLFFA